MVTFINKECNGPVPIPEDAKKTSLDKLNGSLGLLTDVCTPAPDGKGSIRGECFGGVYPSYKLMYYSDKKCTTAAPLPDDLVTKF
jgi:hypothetical protein